MEPTKKDHESDLDKAYKEMSLDKEREAKALEWVEVLLGDSRTNEPDKSPQ